jgi:hypothetical protein
MIDPEHDLSITKQAEVLKISRGSVYYLPRPVRSTDLAIMQHLDRLLEFPFAGSRMLRGLLALQGCKIDPQKSDGNPQRRPQHHSRTQQSARCDDQAENRRVRRGLTVNWTDQRACGLPRMVTIEQGCDIDLLSRLRYNRSI